MTEKKKSIKAKLQEARVKLQQTSLKKSGENTYAHFKYYELKDFLPAVNCIFNELGLCSNFSIKDAVATLEIMDVEDNETIEFTSPVINIDLSNCADTQEPLRTQKQQGVFQKASLVIQSIGAMHTYMKRYLYLNAMEIVENDAINATAGKDNEPSGGKNVVYIGQLKREINSKADLKALEQFVRTEADNIKSRLDERQKQDLKEYINERKCQLAPMVMA